MALGFQNCCDVEDYFYVTGIPGSVSEFEIYYIETVEGDTLCGTYVELPTLDYQPITYDLIGMTAQTSCANCILLRNFLFSNFANKFFKYITKVESLYFKFNL